MSKFDMLNMNSRIINVKSIGSSLVVYHFVVLTLVSAIARYAANPIAIKNRPCINTRLVGGNGNLPGSEAYEKNRIQTATKLIPNAIADALILAHAMVLLFTGRCSENAHVLEKKGSQNCLMARAIPRAGAKSIISGPSICTGD